MQIERSRTWSRVEQVIDLNATEIFKFFTAMPVLPFSNEVVYVINFDKPYTVFTNLWLCVKGYNLQENRQHFLKKYVQRNVKLTPFNLLTFPQDCYDRNCSRYLSFLENWEVRLQQNFQGLFVCLFIASFIDWLSFANF